VESTEHLTFAREGATAIVTMNRPEAKNALSLPMLVGMADAWEEIDSNDDIRCAILTGAGGTFCAGMDLKSMGGTDAEKYKARREADPDLHWKALLRHYDVKKPLIAAVEGWAVAGGTEILQATDIRVAGASAVFGVFEAKRGLFPLGGSTVRLRRQIPYTVAMDLLLTAREVPADEALRIGLIGHVVPDGTALDKALEIAAVIGQNGPLAVEAIKRSVRETEGLSEVDGLARELEIGWPIFASQGRHRGTEGLRREEASPTSPASEPTAAPGRHRRSRPRRCTQLHGDEPVNRLASAIRRISDVVVGAEVPDSEMARAADQLTQIAQVLEESASTWSRLGVNLSGHPQDFFPNSPIVGYANPIAPPADVWAVVGEDGQPEIRGRVTFSNPYEGPPTVSTAASSPSSSTS
jgi:enoyl-CoA hydratase